MSATGRLLAAMIRSLLASPHRELHDQMGLIYFRDIEENTMQFWKRDVTGKRQQTGVVYFGDSKRRGDAWVPHGHGKRRRQRARERQRDRGKMQSIPCRAWWGIFSLFLVAAVFATMTKRYSTAWLICCIPTGIAIFLYHIY